MYRVSYSRLAGKTAVAKKPQGVMNLTKYYCNMGWEGCRHVWHGFRLLGKNLRIAAHLALRLRRGVALTRRERILLERSTVDLLRLVPFSLFIIVPLGEFLLPVALKMFPELIPSTFETETQGRNKAFAKAMASRKARAKIEEYCTTQIVAYTSDYTDILRRVHRDDKIGKKHVRKIAPMFLTGSGPVGFDKLSPDCMKAMSKVLGVWKNYYLPVPQKFITPILTKKVEKKLAEIKTDDDLLHTEGITMLTREELQNANYVRGMRWVDDDEALVSQLADWIALSRDEAVPYHTLVFIKPTFHDLATSMKSLEPEIAEKLLNTANLPVGIKENMEAVCRNVDDHSNAELDEEVTADDVKDKVTQTTDDEGKVDSDLVGQEGAREAIVQHLNEIKDFDVVYQNIQEMHDVKAAATPPPKSTTPTEGEDDDAAAAAAAAAEITVRHTIKYLAKQAHVSTHIVSNIFDALEMSDYDQKLSKETFKSTMKRLLQK